MIPAKQGADAYRVAGELTNTDLIMNNTSEALTRGFTAVRVAVAIVLGIVLMLEIPNRVFAGRKKAK